MEAYRSCNRLGVGLGTGVELGGGDVDESPFASETSVSVQDQSSQYSCTPRRDSDGLCFFKKNTAHHSVLADHLD